MQEAKMPVVERLRIDLRKAMRDRQTIRIVALRTMLSALDNATAVEVDSSFVPLEGRTPDVPRKELSEAEQLAILRLEAEGRRSAIRQYENLGKVDDAIRLREELAVFDLYLSGYLSGIA